jgi:hypothetical protein
MRVHDLITTGFSTRLWADATTCADFVLCRNLARASYSTVPEPDDDSHLYAEQLNSPNFIHPIRYNFTSSPRAEQA